MIQAALSDFVFKGFKDNSHNVLLDTMASFQGCPISFILTAFLFPTAALPTYSLAHRNKSINPSNENSQAAHKMSYYSETAHHFPNSILSVTCLFFK